MAGLELACLPHTSSLICSEERNSAVKGEVRDGGAKGGSEWVEVSPHWTQHPHSLNKHNLKV